MSGWDELFVRTGSVRALAVLRIALGPITLLHLAPFLRNARDGVAYDDHFWEPYASWMPSIPSGLWEAMLYVGAGAAVLMALGAMTRISTSVTCAVVTANLLLSQTHFSHNRTFLAILLFGLALLPVGRVLSVDSWWRRWRGRPALGDVVLLWPLFLLRAQVSLVYLASGTSKLVDPDWAGGVVLWDRVVRYQHHLEPWPLPDWGVDFLTWRPLYAVVAPAAILVELFCGIALWAARTRIAAVWVAVLFHLSIEISASVEVFSYAAIAALAIWVTPATRDRSLVAPAGLAQAVRLLDWFGRFRISTGDAVRLEDRDGTELSGPAALVVVGSRLPLTFVFAAPLLALRRFRPQPADLVAVRS